MDNSPKKPNKTYFFESAKVLGVAFEMGYIIAVPIAVFAALGKWLDNKYHTEYYIYIGIVLALLFSTIWLYQRLDALVKKLAEASRHNQSPKKEQNNQEHNNNIETK